MKHGRIIVGILGIILGVAGFTFLMSNAPAFHQAQGLVSSIKTPKPTEKTNDPIPLFVTFGAHPLAEPAYAAFHQGVGREFTRVITIYEHQIKTPRLNQVGLAEWGGVPSHERAIASAQAVDELLVKYLGPYSFDDQFKRIIGRRPQNFIVLDVESFGPWSSVSQWHRDEFFRQFPTPFTQTFIRESLYNNAAFEWFKAVSDSARKFGLVGYFGYAPRPDLGDFGLRLLALQDFTYTPFGGDRPGDILRQAAAFGWHPKARFSGIRMAQICPQYEGGNSSVVQSESDIADALAMCRTHGMALCVWLPVNEQSDVIAVHTFGSRLRLVEDAAK